MSMEEEINRPYSARANRERRGMRGGTGADGQPAGPGHPGYEVKKTAKPPKAMCLYCGHKSCRYSTCGCVPCHLDEALAEVA